MNGFFLKKRSETKKNFETKDIDVPLDSEYKGDIEKFRCEIDFYDLQTRELE